jgi:hypothetical protein
MGIAVKAAMPPLTSSSPKVKFVRFLSAEPYTRIKSLTAVVRHFGDLGKAGSDTSRFTRSTLPRVVPCANPRCCDGGYDIGPLLDELLAKDATEVHTMLPCRGTDGSPLGRDSHLSSACTNSVEIELQLSYRTDATRTTQPTGTHAPDYAYDL